MSWSEPVYAAIAESLTQTVGLAFPETRRTFAETAMRRAIAAAHERSPERYAARLSAEPALLRALVSEITIGETYFFRDPAQFDVVRSTIVPEIARARGSSEHMRIWSAGCATGEEAYSLAMLVAECGYADRTSLLATDVSATAVDTARRGIYGSWSFRRIAADWRERCFVPAGKRWAVAPEYRRVEFAVHNLMQPAPHANDADRFDLIVCRNVLLYFESDALERALQHLADALAPGGWLVMSPTDPVLSAQLDLEAVSTPAGIVYRRRIAVPAAAPAPAVARTTASPRARPASRARRVRATAAPAAARPPASASESPDPEVYVARALACLDASQPDQAVIAARGALFLDRTLAIAHLLLARALRLTGSRTAARRALTAGAALLALYGPDEAVRGANGASAGTLIAVATAELALLAGPHVQ